MEGVAGLEFISNNEIRAHFFRRPPANFSNMELDKSLIKYLSDYRNRRFFHRRPELDGKKISWYDCDFGVIPTEIRPRLDALAETINLI